jgi:glycosyltransferase involved in cell wall biosynthesis
MHLIVAYWTWHSDYIRSNFDSKTVYVDKNKIMIENKTIYEFNYLIFTFFPKVFLRIRCPLMVQLIYRMHGSILMKKINEYNLNIDTAHIWIGFDNRVIPFLKSRGCKVIAERSGTYPTFQKQLLRKEKKRWGLKFYPAQDLLPDWRIKLMNGDIDSADICLVPSIYCKKTFPENIQHKVVVLPLGSNLSVLPLNLELNRTGVLCVSGASLRKGLDYLKNFKSSISIKVVMTRSWFRKNLSKRVNLCNGQISFLDTMPRADLYDYYDKSDFFIFPSIEDGFGMVVMEAASRGCICYVSKYSGVSELFTDNMLCFVFDPLSDVEWSRLSNEIASLTVEKKREMRQLFTSLAQVNSWEEYTVSYSKILIRT